EEGLIDPKTPGKIKMEAPAGLVEIEYQMSGKKVEWVRLTNVKSYLAAENLSVDCPGLGELYFDVAYGGNDYAIVDPQKNFSGVLDVTAGEILQLSQTARERNKDEFPAGFVHPEHDPVRDVSHVIWTGTPVRLKSTGRNAAF